MCMIPLCHCAYGMNSKLSHAHNLLNLEIVSNTEMATVSGITPQPCTPLTVVVMIMITWFIGCGKEVPKHVRHAEIHSVETMETMEVDNGIHVSTVQIGATKERSRTMACTSTQSMPRTRGCLSSATTATTKKGTAHRTGNFVNDGMNEVSRWSSRAGVNLASGLQWE